MPAFDSSHPYWLPEEFSYLNDVLAKYTDDSCTEIDDAYRLADRADAIQLTELAAAYRLIVKHEHVHSLSALAVTQEGVFRKGWDEWCKIAEAYGAKGLPVPVEFEPQHRPRARRLFYIFDKLARKGLPPFHTREVEYSPPPIRLDWSKLPAELAYFAEAAFKYGKIQFDEQRDQLSRQITPQTHAELRAIADRIRSNQHDQIANDWLNKFSPTEHREASLVMWMLATVNEMIPELPPDQRSSMGLDWSKLPRGLQYLWRDAEAYGMHETPDARATLIRELQDEHAEVVRENSRVRRMLRRLAGRQSPRQPRALEETRYYGLLLLSTIADRRDRRRARTWAAKFPPTEHRESKLVLSLLALLDEAFGKPEL